MKPALRIEELIENVPENQRVDNSILLKCQEQIELSGFVAHELSAFSVLQGSLIFEQEESGGRALPRLLL
jgi:hypothetical protein